MSLTCVIVDDSEEFLAAATHLLAAQGIAVVGQASSGAQALGLVARLRPDVVLVDVELGDEDGIEVARHMGASGRATSVILISLRDRNEISELMVGSGAAGFLRKDALDAQGVADLFAQWRRRDDGAEPRPAG